MSESFVARELRVILVEYAERVASGEVVTPPEFVRRTTSLRKRGLSEVVARQLREAGSADLLRQVESLTAEQIRELNEAAA